MAVKTLEFKTILFLGAKITALVIQTCLNKTVSFKFRNQGFPNLDLVVTIGKISVEDLDKPEIHRFF